jgi:hypothetical protein
MSLGRVVLLVVFLFTVVGLAAPAGAAIPAGNLIINPGAEGGAAATDDVHVFAPDFPWSTSTGFTQVAYGTAGFPSVQVANSIGGGNAFFAGGPSNASSSAEQTVDVAGAGTEIDAGDATASLSAHLGGVGTQDDAAKVDATFLAADGATLGTLTVGPVFDAERGGATTLVAKSASATVPAGTRAIRVRITATRAGGSYNDGYADNIRLTLAGPGPPDTTIDSRPPDVTSDNTPTFTFGSDRTGTTFECRVDTAAFEACTTPHTTAPLPDGGHTFAVRAISSGGAVDPDPAVDDFTVDTATPLVARFTVGPNPTCAGVPVRFDAADSTSPNGVVRYRFVLTGGLGSRTVTRTIADSTSPTASWTFEWEGTNSPIEASLEYFIDLAGRLTRENQQAELSTFANILAGLRGGSSSQPYQRPRATVELTITDARGAQATSAQAIEFAQERPSQPRTGCPRSLRDVNAGFSPPSFSKLRANASVVRASVACRSGTTCVGALAATLLPSGTGHAAARRRAPRVVLAAAVFRVPAGTKKLVRARLTRAGKRLLRRRGHVRAKLTNVSLAPSGKVVVHSRRITLKRRRH